MNDFWFGASISNLGMIGVMVTSVRLIIRAFKKSTLWGILSALIPFVYLIFAIKYRKNNWILGLLNIIFTILFFWGIVIIFNSEIVSQFLNIEDLNNIDIENFKEYIELLKGNY